MTNIIKLLLKTAAICIAVLIVLGLLNFYLTPTPGQRANEKALTDQQARDDAQLDRIEREAKERAAKRK